MKIVILPIAYLLLTPFTAQPLVRETSPAEANGILQKCVEALQGLKEIRYQYTRSLHYFSEDYHRVLIGNTCLDFKENDNVLGFRFQVENEATKVIFNGSERIDIDKQTKTRALVTHPERDNFAGFPFFTNSPVTLRNVLPKVLADGEITKQLSDTVINAKPYHLLSLVQKNKDWSYLGDFTSLRPQLHITYKIIIDKKSYLPIEVIQTNDLTPKDYVSCSFAYDALGGQVPQELSWYYSSYSDYAALTKESLRLIEVGTQAPEWKLPVHGAVDSIGASALKGQYVLLAFWMKNCGYCIQAVSSLNAIVDEFQTTGLKVIGINPVDDDSDITKFYNRHRPQYLTAVDRDHQVAQQFGVEAYPQIVLLDGASNVVYTGSIDRAAIEKIIANRDAAP